MQVVLHVLKTFIGNYCNREETSLRHIPMVAKRHLKSRFALFQTSLILFLISFICQMLAKLSGFNPKGPYVSLEKEKQNIIFVLCSPTPQRGRVKFPCRGHTTMAKNCTIKCDARANMFVCQSKPIDFLLLAVAIARTPYNCCHPGILLPW